MIDYFDMRSVIHGNSLSNIILAVIMYLVWRKYRGKFRGLGYWLIAGLLQVGGEVLLLTQGIVHDFVSVFLANLSFTLAGAVLFYGMERFTFARGRHGLFFLILLPVIPLHYYFTFVKPLLYARVLILSATEIIVSLNFIYLLNVRVKKKERKLYRMITGIFALVALVFIAMIVYGINTVDRFSLDNTDFIGSILLLVAYMLFVLLVFSFIVLINSRLFMDTSAYLRERENLVREFKRLASTDGLTGIHNRMKVELLMTAEVLRSKRYGRLLSVLLIDVDHFKQVNDNYGHSIGDSVLRDVAAVLNDNIREADILGRWGGEEFLIVAPETDTDGALRFGEKLREAVERHRFIKDIRITISIGVATLMEGEWEDDMVRRADEAMYQAKESGRNRIV